MALRLEPTSILEPGARSTEYLVAPGSRMLVGDCRRDRRDLNADHGRNAYFFK